MSRKYAVAVLFLLGCLAAAAPAFAQAAPPASPQADEVTALVDRAAAAIDAKGKSIFPDFHEAGGPWRSGPLYLFVVDLTGKTLVNAAFPKFEGTDVKLQKDAAGKLFGIAFIDTVKASGSGWVDYMWPKPGETQPSRKWTYVKAATVDGVPALVGAGFYPQ
jgi:cytochrome c